MAEAYPLAWPEGWKRTAPDQRATGRFDATLFGAATGLMRELRLMGATSIVLSTNVLLRLDGLPYAKQRAPEDPGAAVYYVAGGRSFALACDRWRKIEDNVQALRKTIEAIRGIERWGASEMIERAFTGFTALPPAAQEWWQILEVAPTASLAECRAARARLVKIWHPDVGTDPTGQRMQEINEAFEKRRSLE